MKRQIAITTAALIFLSAIFTGAASAGAARRHTMEGFVLGAGVTLLGTAIIHNMSRPRTVVVHQRHGRRHNQGRRSQGYWETRKVWVPAVTETRWNPGHYNRNGRWVQGRHQAFVISEGHWEKQKIWVSSRCGD